MSLFRTVNISCPHCGATSPFEMVLSVNADRRPDLRDAILGRTFQRQDCPSCGEAVRVAPELTYVHLGNRQWIAVWPESELKHWAAVEQRTRNAFEAAYGSAAPGPAAELGRDLSVRVTFGWEALREKLIAAAAGLDDRTLELAKLALLRNVSGLLAGGDGQLRLIAVEGDGSLQIGRIPRESELLIEVLSVPSSLLSEIEAEPEAWHDLREKLGEGPFVDVARLTVEPEPIPQTTQAA